MWVKHSEMRAWRLKRIREEQEAYEREKEWVKETSIKIVKEREKLDEAGKQLKSDEQELSNNLFQL